MGPFDWDSEDAERLARVEALVREHPETEVPVIEVAVLRRALGWETPHIRNYPDA